MLGEQMIADVNATMMMKQMIKPQVAGSVQQARTRPRRATTNAIHALRTHIRTSLVPLPAHRAEKTSRPTAKLGAQPRTRALPAHPHLHLLVMRNLHMTPASSTRNVLTGEWCLLYSLFQKYALSPKCDSVRACARALVFARGCEQTCIRTYMHLHVCKCARSSINAYLHIYMHLLV